MALSGLKLAVGAAKAVVERAAAMEVGQMKAAQRRRVLPAG